MPHSPDTFYVSSAGVKLSGGDAESVVKVLTSMLHAHYSMKAAASSEAARRPVQSDAPAAAAAAAKGNAGLVYSLMDSYLPNDVLSVQRDVLRHVEHSLGRTRYRFDDFEAYQATSLSVRDRLIEWWNDTNLHYKTADPKRVYYLSMEFLMGRSLLNALHNLNLVGPFGTALGQLGYTLEALADKERDAALGNGGLGRLAACFLDSMTTLNLPAWGYGLRYQYGMFRQSLADGFQRESPDLWLNFGHPWEVERLATFYTVKYYGHVSGGQEQGRHSFVWHAGEEVIALAYDTPIPGWQTRNVNNLRLWSARPAREFDLESFNTGDYVAAILQKQRAETISAVLYPDDRTYQGKELRLKQQFFMVSATLQDIMRRFKEAHPEPDALTQLFPSKVALQLNDTHPTIGVPELMRLLMDDHGLGWTAAWEVTTKVFSFTNHTVLPEALEKWPVELMEALLPRHMQIVYDINWRFCQEVQKAFPGDVDRLARMSCIEEGDVKCVRMAHVALVASHTVNGVAAIHSELIKHTIFKDFYAIWPHKFQNKTNGVTPRRWLAICNPPLRGLITQALGTDAWIRDLELLKGLKPMAEDPAFQQQWQAVKHAAKVRLAGVIKELRGVAVSPDALFDIQVKRIHEYKRQLLNVLSIVHRYQELKRMPPAQRAQQVARVCVIGGKAAPGYDMAKRIIKLVNAVGDVVNGDPDIGDLLKVVFLPDYNVSLAEVIVPASELSQHISTAGTEASGTSNMKFAMNGCLIIGTMDGANVEIAEELAALSSEPAGQHMFIFGASAQDVPRLRRERASHKPDGRFNAVCASIRSGAFGFADFFAPLMDSIQTGDYYLLAPDFNSYLDAQAAVDAAYKDQARWTRSSILSTASSGKFSSDRTIAEYANQIWHVQPCPRDVSS